ncbi:hypothetical protein KVR01_011672 [Diaporthe batatas]|uniref:uncharacterized protein n=1 Tax=Diaporthe batatas TaxID=748121 RepID=UPI001D041100|nr:uncharacterized protein KVR01_011672 [Diaporthe batatas]KAG8158550.1 hypothetical protein KVR01_011672 [Diaporthe batatas]
MRISNFLLGLLYTASTTLGCYGTGFNLGDLKGGHLSIEECIKDYCKGVRMGIKGHQAKDACYQFTPPKSAGWWDPGWFNKGRKLDISIRNDHATTQGMSNEECEEVFLKIYRNCPKGSLEQHKGFTLYIDPNRGGC